MPPVTGNDATIAALQLIIAGDQYNTISKPSEIVAAAAANVAVKFLSGETPKAETTLYDTPSQLFMPAVVTAENLKAEIIDKKHQHGRGALRRPLCRGLQEARHHPVIRARTVVRPLSAAGRPSLCSRERLAVMTDILHGPASHGELVLSLRGISKNFGAVSALTDIDLDVHAGEVVALVGDNGAGKSTLVKILAGVHQPSSGTISFRGKHGDAGRSRAPRSTLGIATVFQDLALCENLDVVANIFLGKELNPLRLDEVAMEITRLDAAQRALGAHPERARTGRLALRRPAPDRGDRPLAAARSEAHHARRADRGARRRPDRRGART